MTAPSLTASLLLNELALDAVIYIENKTMFPAPVVAENLLAKLPADVAENMSVIAMLIAMVIGLAQLGYALFLLRKSKWEEIKANFTR